MPQKQNLLSVVVDAQQTFIVTFMFRRKQAPWFGFARPSNVPVDVAVIEYIYCIIVQSLAATVTHVDHLYRVLQQSAIDQYHDSH